MAQENQLGAIEKAEERGASIQGAVLPDSAESAPSSTPDASRSPSSLNSERSQEAENGAPDLEQLAAVSTGPVYSAFGKWKKRYIVIMVTFAAFISPTSANIYFPALIPLQQDLNVSTKLINLTLTSYMIFQGLAPTVFGDLADMAGRRPSYILAFVVYVGANIGLALQDSYAALFILRCLQSTGSSGAIALGYGVVADISTSSERGKYMGIVGAGTMLGPAFSPVIGGILTQFLGWRSIFWFLVILAGIFLVLFTLTVPETGRNVVGNGSVPPQGWNMTILEWYKFRKEARSANGLSRTTTAENRRREQELLASHRTLRFPNPLKTVHIIMEKDMAVVLFYNALIYTAFYDIIASIPQLFAEIYHFNDLQIGLCYLPFGVGCAVASFVNGKLLDRNYKRVARQIGFTIDRKRGDDLRNFPIERARLELIWPILTFGLLLILCYGWVLEKNANLAAPLILQFFIGMSVNGSFNILSTLVVDLYPQSPSTATAANNLVRCLIGAGGTGIISIMIDHMGRGWCFTFISLVCLVTMPMLWVELKWGPGWREERRVRMEKAAEEKKRLEEQKVEDSGSSGVDNTQFEPAENGKEKE
ncbi:major facilitator superfamily domain-containing protein [Tricladium varicosporioides]|nr:major facilitator superfamily domain-containing protein [Hymenoscyphus varicosporioides]